MAYDAARGNVVLFGGVLGNDSVVGDADDTWTWNGSGWTQRQPAQKPPAGDHGAMAYDAARRLVVHYSGRTGGTWTWDGTNWTNRQPVTSPDPVRAGPSMAFDTARGRAVLYGGLNFGAFYDDTWTWDGTTWARQTTPTRPPGRHGASMAYDEARNIVVLFGGYSGAINGYRADTWVWNGASWANVTPPSGNPSPRADATMVWDAAARNIVLFGGHAGSDPLADTWIWNGTAWSQAPASSTNPPARRNAAMSFDASRGNVVLFGGCQILCDSRFGPTRYLADTWTRTSTTPSLPARVRLQPRTATATLGQTHSVAASVTDAAGNSVAGARIDFRVTGANAVSGTQSSDVNGQAVFTYQGTKLGVDTIRASVQGQNTPITDQVTVSWVTPPCGVSMISVDRGLSNGVVSGRVTGTSPCNAILEVRNSRALWVNLRLTEVGSVSTKPSAGVHNLYASHGILGPQATVRYMAQFTASGQSVDILLDVSNALGQGAQLMNLLQAAIDLASLKLPGLGQGFKLTVQMYPQVVDAFGAMPNLRQAADALFRANPDLDRVAAEIDEALRAGEFETLGSTLERLGLEGAKEAFKLLAGEPGKFLSFVDVIIRNYGNVVILLFREPAGSISFDAK